MSNHLVSLAYKVDVGTLLRKAVLVLLADKAGDGGEGIWASKQTMADELCCTKQSIINTIQQFLAEGLLDETGEHQVKNGHTVVYALNVEAMQALPMVKRHRSKTFTGQSKGLTGQRRLPVNDVGGTGQPGLPNPSLNPPLEEEANASPSSRAGKPDPFPKPDGVDRQVWSDFLKNRSRKALTNTATAHKRLMNDLHRLADDEWTIPKLVEFAAARGWGGIYDPRKEDHGRNSFNPEPTGVGPTERAALAIIKRRASTQG